MLYLGAKTNQFDKRKWRHYPRQEVPSLEPKLKSIIEIYFSPEKPNQSSLPFNQDINSPQTRSWIIFWKPCPGTAAVNYKTSSRRKRHGVSWQPFSAKAVYKRTGEISPARRQRNWIGSFVIVF
ncbi:hypothetical protein CDAR_99841 [Caerostris darwini]|uniref:Uncharacterized protein n=1 Tax=Caerostris darwini TaxID=1538125 RepID=A0AAV4X0E2_9ARAC|nr:hypothetical protein CDAR_99841 [Caerostris darwini]